MRSTTTTFKPGASFMGGHWGSIIIRFITQRMQPHTSQTTYTMHSYTKSYILKHIEMMKYHTDYMDPQG